MHSRGVPRHVVLRESNCARMQTQMQPVGLVACLLMHWGSPHQKTTCFSPCQACHDCPPSQAASMQHSLAISKTTPEIPEIDPGIDSEPPPPDEGTEPPIEIRG